MDAKDIEKRAIINILKQLNSQFTHDTSEANAQKIINYVNENRVYIEEEISNRKSILGFFYIFISIVAIIIAFNSDNEKTFGVVFGITILGGHFVFLFISSWSSLLYFYNLILYNRESKVKTETEFRAIRETEKKIEELEKKYLDKTSKAV